jgi:hypothetical protein
MSQFQNIDAWVGKGYSTKLRRRVLVIGESRYDEYYDNKCIIAGVPARGGGGTFTNFMQAALGVHHSELRYRKAVSGFWDKAIFYNYLIGFYPLGPRKTPPRRIRYDKRNRRALLHVLKTYKPTHAIVWGKQNWQALWVDRHAWRWEGFLRGPRPDCEFCSVVVDRHRTLFTFVKHPSAGFSSTRWHPMLKRFLALKSQIVSRT